ncbi:hypothetical protein OIU76_007007 [Salix suchowensis]|nr:hypothetical protein OIU76_007007 [Salix suchowensis]
MLGDSSSVLATTTTALAASGGGGGVGNRESPPLDGSNHEGSNIDVGGEDDKGAIEGHRSFGGNRWPRQETLALLKIRSDMDVTFRDAGVKGPLWEDVSRKLAELGYNRSGKKCKEKFENVFKYHKRTKDGRSAATLATNTSQAAVTSSINLAAPPFPAANPTICHPSQAINHPQTIIPSSFPNFSSDLISNSPSSSTSSDVELQGRRKRKRKWKDFFERLMTEVIQRQEETQKRFLEAIEKRENERMAREQSWRMQEMARINREHEILAQERSIAATKDAAVMAFLQKLSQQQNPGQVQNNPPPTPLPPTPPPALPPISQQTPTPPHPLPVAQVPLTQPVANLDITKSDNGDLNFMSASSSRWPKVEVEALIGLRTNLDCKYQENGP